MRFFFPGTTCGVNITKLLEETCHVCGRNFSDGCAHVSILCRWRRCTGALLNNIPCCKNKTKLCQSLPVALQHSRAVTCSFKRFPVPLTIDCQCLVRQCTAAQSRLVAVVYVIGVTGETSAASSKITSEMMICHLRNDSSHPFDPLNTVFPSCLAYSRVFS